MSVFPHMYTGIHLTSGAFRIRFDATIPVVTIHPATDDGYPELNIYPPREHAEELAAVLNKIAATVTALWQANDAAFAAVSTLNECGDEWTR